MNPLFRWVRRTVRRKSYNFVQTILTVVGMAGFFLHGLIWEYYAGYPEIYHYSNLRTISFSWAGHYVFLNANEALPLHISIFTAVSCVALIMLNAVLHGDYRSRNFRNSNKPRTKADRTDGKP